MSAMKHSYTLAHELIMARNEYEEFTANNTVNNISISREADITRSQLWAKASDLDSELIQIGGFEWRCRVINAVIRDMTNDAVNA